MTPAIRDKILGLLFYDNRKSGAHGRALREDIPELNLKKGDRVEPSKMLLDIGGFNRLSGGERITFWRRSAETLCTHRCLLFEDDTLGVTPTRSICIDILHTLHLGPIHSWCMAALWFLLDFGAWGGYDPSPADKRPLALERLRNELKLWYKHDDMGKTCTRISFFTQKMIGTRNNKRLKTKAAETYGLLLWLVKVLSSKVLSADGLILLELGRILHRIYTTFKNSPVDVSESVVEDLCRNNRRMGKGRERNPDGGV